MDFSKKVAPSWISPSFNDVHSSGHSKTNFTKSIFEKANSQVPHKRRKSTFSKNKLQQSQEEIPWIEKFKPATKEDLAVHKKKVTEVETWLTEKVRMCVNNTNKKAPILIMTGPTGSGKTATIHALCSDLNIEVQEWVNPDQTHSWKPHNEGFSVHNDMRDTYQSQSSLFSNFLLRANKYSLFTQRQRIILVEDIPNVFLRDSSTFHSILRKYHQSARSPIIFIISDDTKGENIVLRLLPKLLQTELNIYNISFNPVAPMMLIKILTKINGCIPENCSQTKLTKTHLEEIAADSTGDIRNAVNALQFYTIPRSTILKSKTQLRKRTQSGMIKSTDDDSISSNSNKDSSLFLFHALGKILYCKRGAKSKEIKEPLPPHMTHLERLPLLIDPEDVYGKTSISAEGFSLFLHQNYMAFIDNINVASECALWLSQSEILHSHWNDRNVMDGYAASLTTRGLMFNLVPTDSGNRWRPLHKPQFYSVRKTKNSTKENLRNVFQEMCTSSRQLQTEILPFMRKIGVKNLRYDQAELVNKLGEMSIRNATRPLLESLDTKDDPFEMDTNENVVQHSNLTSKPEVPLQVDQESVDDEIVIEDYDF